MSRIIILLIIIFSFAGCTIKEIEDNDIDYIIDLIIQTNHKLVNQTSKGYKYYLPKGVTLIDNINYNEKLYATSNVYYLYVDIASFYFQKELNYQINKDAYFSKNLSYNKKGYLEINKIDNLYFIEMMYNYAKIETLVEEKDLQNTIINLSYILSSITFNQKVIKLMFDEDRLNFNEQKVDIFETKGRESKFIDYVNEYDVYIDPGIEEEEAIINIDLDKIE